MSGVIGSSEMYLASSLIGEPAAVFLCGQGLLRKEPAPNAGERRDGMFKNFEPFA